MRRGYCTKTKQEWPDSGSTLENILCNFYEKNSSQDLFCIANILVLMVSLRVAVRNSLLKAFSGKFRACRIIPNFLAACKASPAKVWGLSRKEDGCWKIGPAFGEAPGFSPPRPPQRAAVDSSIVFEDAVENRGLYRVFVSRFFFSKGLRHYSTSIARLNFLSGLERGG